MSPISRIEEVAASQRRLDAYLVDLSKAVGAAVGELGKMEQAKLEGKLGRLEPTVAALLGRGDLGDPIANTLGNVTPLPGPGNALTEPMLDTVVPGVLSTTEQRFSNDLFGKYVLNSGTALAQTVGTYSWSDSANNSSSSSLLTLLATSTGAGDVTASFYTSKAITVGAGSATMPYISCGLRVLHLPASVVTNITTLTATFELVRNLGASETVESTVDLDILALALGGNHLIPGSVSSPTMLRLNGDSTGWAAAIGRTYDLRVKIHIVASGANASGILVALAEPTIGFSYTPDPLPYQFIRPSAASGPYCDSSDGDVTIAADTTLTRDMYYGNLTVAAGKALNCAGFTIFVAGTLTMGAGAVIHDDGGAGGTGGNAGSTTGGTAGTAGTAAGTGGGRWTTVAGKAGSAGYDLGVHVTGDDGAIGNNGVTGSWATGIAEGGGGGGHSTSGGSNGATGTDGTASSLATVPWHVNATWVVPNNTSGWLKTMAAPGSGGGGGGDNLYGAGGGGGGSGAPGGVAIVVARVLNASAGTIRANGGDGAKGGNGSSTQAPYGGGGGGGGSGGNGGLVVLVYGGGALPTLRVSGGAAGTYGSGGETAQHGTAGSAGSAGLIMKFRS